MHTERFNLFRRQMFRLPSAIFFEPCSWRTKAESDRRGSNPRLCPSMVFQRIFEKLGDELKFDARIGSFLGASRSCYGFAGKTAILAAQDGAGDKHFSSEMHLCLT